MKSSVSGYSNTSIFKYVLLLVCGGWKQTLQCDPNGSRFPQNDTACDVAIDQSLSGYCECMTHKVKKVCSPWGFDNCYDACEEKSKYTHLKKLKLIKYSPHLYQMNIKFVSTMTFLVCTMDADCNEPSLSFCLNGVCRGKISIIKILKNQLQLKMMHLLKMLKYFKMHLF